MQRTECHHCFSPQKSFCSGEWGANWRILAKPDTKIVPALSQQLHTNVWWEGTGTGAPIIRIVSPNHTSPWHYNSWKMVLPFITRKHLYVKIGCDPKGVLGCFYQTDVPEQDWVTVCTSRPYLFLATPGTAQVFYNESIKIYSLHVCRLYICQLPYPSKYHSVKPHYSLYS